MNDNTFILRHKPKAKLIQDQDGYPLIELEICCDDIETTDLTNHDHRITIHLLPIEAKRLGSILNRVGQDGIDVEMTQLR